MSAAEELARLVQQRASRLTPDLARAVLDAFSKLRDSMSEAELARAIQEGGADKVVADLMAQAIEQVAFQPVKDQIRAGVKQSATLTARVLPIAADKAVGFAFDFLNPRVIDAIRALETAVITSLSADIRETVRTHVEAGLQAGQSPMTVARQIKPLIGLSPSQLTQVENFRAALEGKDGRNPFDYARRDKRFDGTVRKALDGDGLSAEQIDSMVAKYTKRRIALNAETTARTAAMQAQKAGQRLSWQDAIDKGVIDRSRIMKTWIGVMDSRERPEHVAMQGQTVPFDAPWSNGEQVPGESTFNCRCVARYFVARAS